MSLDRRFLTSTRGRVVALLRGQTLTVDELAAQLDLTDNAVRSHLTSLERDGLVEQRGQRRMGGKPAYLYGLTAEAEEIFPKAYEPVLRQLLDALGGRMPRAEIEGLLRAAGRGLAARLPAPPDGDQRSRLDIAVGALNALGGSARVVSEGDAGFTIRSGSCPLAAIVPDHPEICQVAETLVSELSGVRVRACCERAVPPRCCFEAIPDTP